MEKTWLVVANRAKALFLDNVAINKPLRVVEKLDYEEGRLHSAEMRHDRPGRSFDSTSNHRHSYSKENDEQEQALIQFAHQVGQIIESRRRIGSFERLFIVAEAKFLGQIRKNLSAQTEGLVAGTLAKDLANEDLPSLHHHIVKNGLLET